MYKSNISRCPLFLGIDEEMLKGFITWSVSEVRTFQKGEHVVRQGDSINFLYLLVEGIVRTEMNTAEGNLVEIEFIEAVRPLAPAFIFSDQHRFPVDAIAMDKSVVYMIPKSVFLKEMMLNEVLLRNFLRLNSNITVFLSGKVKMLSIKSLRAKLSLYILENTTASQNSFTLKRTQTQLAEYFGVQRPSLARTIGEMINDGAISLYKRELKVLNRKQLESNI
ncbi:MAG: Crp/Fnr family transcriptional regulator [Bacteroidia bacterium]|nr:Crp/Fnr family transcriptional regulator [Bacteroidia bacterium]